jgi:hypothetical protein
MIVIVALGITWRPTVHAASPPLGAAATYGVLANTYTNSGAATTTINGDVGFLVAPTIPPGGTHTNYGSGAPYATAGADQATALTALNNHACTFTWGAAVDLFLDSTHGPAGVYTPGVYCSVGAMNVTGSLTFNGSGTYIFRATGALGTTAGISINLTGGASACDVFWTPHATTLGAGTSFVGTLIDNDAVTVGANTVWTGRSLSFNGPVTTGASSTITVPSCTPPPATLHVIKTVINDNGGTTTAASFSLHVKLAGTDVAGSPAAGAAAPGTPYSLAADTYVVSEDANAGYAQSFSGDCNSSGSVTLFASDDKTCTITNNDRPASITVIKTVINDSGGTKIVADFSLFVGTTPVTSGVSNNFSASASYAISENADSGYAQSFSGDCDVSGNLSLSLGDNKICTITNNDIPATLHVIKVVINDSGGTTATSSFNLHVKLSGSDVAGSPAAGAAAPGTPYTLSVGTYVISEDANTAYAQSFSGDCNSSGSVALALADDKTCTITNNDRPGLITVIKTVINDDGGTKVVANFPLFVGAMAVTSGTANSFSAPASYAITETADSGYAQSFSGACDSTGNLSLNPGDNKTCTITNDDITAVVIIPPMPPIITTAKAANPASPPAGSDPTLPNTGAGPQPRAITSWSNIIPAAIFVGLFSLYPTRKKPRDPRLGD